MKYLLDFNGVSEVTDEFYASIPSSAFTEKLNELKEGKTLVILPEKNLNVQASTRNIEGAKAILANTINVYDLLRYTNLVLTLDTVKKLEEVYA